MANNHAARKSLVTAKHHATRVDWASPAQKEAVEYGPDPLCLSGGYGASKSYALCLKALMISDFFPGNRGVIARNQWVDLQSTTMKTFFKICPPSTYHHGRRSDQQKILQLNNGSEILWLHLDDPERENVIQGIEINWFFIDQAEEVEEEIFDKLSARLGRWDQAVVPDSIRRWYEMKYRESWPWRNEITGKLLVPTYGMIACNPDLLTHWIYRRFHPESPDFTEKSIPDPAFLTGTSAVARRGAPRVSYKDLGYKMIRMPSLENKHLPQQNRSQLLSRGKSFISRYVEAKWGQVEGIIHEINPKSILEASHDVLQYVFRGGHHFHRSYDHGDASPSCMLYCAIDTDGNLIFYAEYYKPNQLISQHRRNVHTLEEHFNTKYMEGHDDLKFDSSLADPAIWNKTLQSKGGRSSINDEYEDNSYDPETVLIFDKADNDELATRNLINELLAIDPEHVNPFTGEKGAPYVYFVIKSPKYPYGCAKVIQQTESQRREKIGTYLGEAQYSDDRIPTVQDHAYDSLRYQVAGRNVSTPRRKVRPVKGTFKGAMLLLKQMKGKRVRALDRVAAREARRYGRL